MKTIRLTQGQVALVDDEDFERLVVHSWCAMWHQQSRGFYAMRGTSVNNCRVSIRMHREIVGANPGQVVDHINHNTLDNRKANLRICTSADNARNAKLRSDSSSGFKGVSWNRSLNLWVARVNRNKKQMCIGYFKNPTDAARAYDAAAIQEYGEFALVNFSEAMVELQREKKAGAM